MLNESNRVKIYFFFIYLFHVWSYLVLILLFFFFFFSLGFILHVFWWKRFFHYGELFVCSMVLPIIILIFLISNKRSRIWLMKIISSNKHPQIFWKRINKSKEKLKLKLIYRKFSILIFICNNLNLF